ncbi:MAG: hypothetical protein R6X10_05580 [Desulfobacterales bacterium]
MKPRALPEPSAILLYPVVMLALVLLVSVSRENALAAQVLSAGYNEGFYVKSREEGGMEVHLGGSFQVDYCFYAENERADNRFDVRRARLKSITCHIIRTIRGRP